MSEVVLRARERCSSLEALRLRRVRATATSLLIAVTLGVGLGSSSQAAEPAKVAERANDSTWLPSASVFGTLLVGSARGEVTSSVRSSASGDDLFVEPAVGLGTEILTPAFRAEPVELRLLAHTGFAYDFGPKRSLALEGDPGEFVYPTVENPLPGGSTITPAQVAGRGSVTQAQTQPLLFFAGAGLALGFDLWDRQVRIKPTLEYKRDEVKVTGQVNEVTGTAVVFPDGTIDPDFRQIRISGSGTQVFHSLGPGLELEVDAARAGDFAVTLFLNGRAWAVLGDRNVTVQGSCCSDTGPEESAVWRYEQDEWSFGSSVGIRVRWSPEH